MPINTRPLPKPPNYSQVIVTLVGVVTIFASLLGVLTYTTTALSASIYLAAVLAGLLILLTAYLRPLVARYLSSVALIILSSAAVVESGSSNAGFGYVVSIALAAVLIGARVVPALALTAVGSYLLASLCSPAGQQSLEDYFVTTAATLILATLLTIFARSLAQTSSELEQRTVQVAVLEERNRIARDLHDSVAQWVGSTFMQAQAASALLARPTPDLAAIGRRVASVEEAAQQGLRAVRQAVLNLRPLPLLEDTLPAALQKLAERMATEQGWQLHLRLDPQLSGLQLAAEVEAGLYHIAQEALHNAAKHSGTRVVALALEVEDDELYLTIADEGRGFDGEAKGGSSGVGLSSMAERSHQLGGLYSLASEPGNGTRVRVVVPLAGAWQATLPLLHQN